MRSSLCAAALKPQPLRLTLRHARRQRPALLGTRRRPRRLPLQLLCCQAKQQPAPLEALQEGDGAAAVRPLPAGSPEESGGGWRSWSPFAYLPSLSSSSSGRGDAAPPAPRPTGAAAAAQLLCGDGMAAEVALVRERLQAAEAEEASPQQQQQRQDTATAPPESPTLIVAAAPEQAAPGSDLLLPSGVPVHHPVLALLRQRAEEGSTPGARTDPFKLGLVVEGGGMRGAVSGGALQVLNQLGLRDCFDAVYGASAGAFNATYFLSQQQEGASIYHDLLCSGEFLSLRRLGLLRRPPPGTPPALDLSFLIDHIMHSVHPLDWGAVLASPVPLKVVASSLDTLDSVLLSGFHSREDLVACLKASANVPELAGGPLEHRGHRLVDAAVFEAIPYRSAIGDGCTHVLVLNNLPRPARDTTSGWLAGALEDAITAVVKRLVLSPPYMKEAWEAELEYLAQAGVREDLLLLRALEPGAAELPALGGAHVLPLWPGPEANYSPVCTDGTTIRAGKEAGRRMMLAVAPAIRPGAPPGGGLADGFGGPLCSGEGNIVPAPPSMGVGRQT